MSAYENQTKLKELSEIWQHVLLEWLLERLGRSFEFFHIQRLTRGLCDFNTAVAFLVM